MGIASPGHELVFEEIPMVSPSRLDSTPRFWNVIYQQYKKAEQIEESLTLARTQKAFLTEEEQNLISSRLRDQFRNILGKRCNSLSMGGAAVSADLKRFMAMLFPMIRVREGYGTTEAGSIADDTGRIAAGIDFKLVDVAQLGYTSADKPFPRGELCVKTPVTIQGYYGNEADTAAAFDSEGFFRTGDVVELFDKRKIRIIDRVKNFFKLSQGEYISSEPIENVYLRSRWIDQIFVGHADLGKYPVQTSVLAVVVPQEATIRSWLDSERPDLRHAEIPDFADLCSIYKKELTQKILAELRAEGLAASLREMEIPCGLVIDSRQWTPENGLLTPSNKLCRPALRAKYHPLLDSIYENAETSSGASSTLSDFSAEPTSSRSAPKTAKDDMLNLLREVLGVGNMQGRSSTTPGLGSSSAETTVKSLGGDSLSAIRLSHVLQSKFSVSVDAGSLINMSVSELEALLASGGTSRAPVKKTDFEAEAALPSEVLNRIRATATTDKSAGEGGILISGGTGFVGAHILAELILNMKRRSPETRSPIHILIRAQGVDLATQRLSQALRSLNIVPKLVSAADVLEHCKVLPGELDAPRFGLPASLYDPLASEVSLIIHGGALVNHVLGYDDLKQSNVGGTLEVIKFASASRKKRIIYLSTVSVFSLGKPISESDRPSLADAQNCGGYAASKWVAERMLDHARDAGLAVNTLRLGMVSWNSRLGVPNRQDWFYRLLLGMWALGAAPKSVVYSQLNLIPMEFVTSIVMCFLDENSAALSTTHLNLVHGALTPLETIIGVLFGKKEVPEASKFAPESLMSPFSSWRALVEKGLNEGRSKMDSVMEKILSPLLVYRMGLPDDKRDEKFQVDTLRSLLPENLKAGFLQPLPESSVSLAWDSIIGDLVTMRENQI